jgi:hypothetical protein
LAAHLTFNIEPGDMEPHEAAAGGHPGIAAVTLDA